jgi:hypothetical protein
VIAMGSTIGKPGDRLLSEGDESDVGQKRPAGCGQACGCSQRGKWPFSFVRLALFCSGTLETAIKRPYD